MESAAEMITAVSNISEELEEIYHHSRTRETLMIVSPLKVKITISALSHRTE